MKNTLASVFTDATGLSGPALTVLILIGLALVLGVSYAYSKRRRR